MEFGTMYSSGNWKAMEILLCFLVFLKLYFWFIAEDGRENDMYYMVTALSEFTKKIVVLAFKNMLTS